MANLLDRLMEMAGPKGELELRDGLEPRPRRYTVVSVDDHLIEPPHLFEGRMPSRFAGRGPRVDRHDDGVDYWVFEDEEIPLLGADAIQGWVPGKGYLGPVNFGEL